MKPRINMIGIITHHLPEMMAFYRDVMGFEIKLQMENYVEFHNDGVRFALSTGEVMAKATDDQSYLEPAKGHALELAFDAGSAEQVDTMYTDLVQKGATPVKEPETMPWNQRTAFFADPDGNVHEVFADLPA